jgi:hypothetical protein
MVFGIFGEKERGARAPLKPLPPRVGLDIRRGVTSRKCLNRQLQ